MADVITGARATVAVPAKVNLFLGVEGRRDDGYHEVVTILQAVDLHDTVGLEVHGDLGDGCPDGVALSLRHDGGPDVPDGDDNLVLKAARLLLDALGVDEVAAADDADTPLLAFRIDKAIPVAAGMAGGSADAAGALIALNALLDCGYDRARLRDLAANLGADVPFCVTGGTALATGTGTATADVLCRGSFHWVLGMFDEPLSTPDVYAAWDRLGHAWKPDHSDVLQAVRSGDVHLLGQGLHNDLQAAAFDLRPALADAVDGFLVDGALGSIVSGSGPTVLALAADAEHAHELAESAAPRFDRVVVARSPVGGPQVRVG